MARALYIHWPFCLKKCPYCDFNSHVRDGVDHEIWRQALIADMRHEARLSGGGAGAGVGGGAGGGAVAGEKLRSIFFGGGTPSLMPPALVSALLDEAERLWGFDSQIEITLEANPSSVEAEKFAELAAAGINRVSLGLQSLNDDELQFLGRLHNVEESIAALGVAQKHFRRVSFDLIYARPGQTESQWQQELERALSFGTDHLSLYQLTIEPNTRFATDVRRGMFMPLDDDPAADLFELTREITVAAGIPAYEVSNHARTGQESQHNLTYWRYQDYCGIGPGAHGRRNGIATLRHKKPENYLTAVSKQSNGLHSEQDLTAHESASEALLMGLRLQEGISLPDIAHRFALREDELIDMRQLDVLSSLGFLWQDSNRLGVTSRGMPVLNAVIAELVNAELVAHE